jgi:glutaredoxin
MLTLYVKTGCPYCAKVLECIRQNGIQFTEKNIKDPKVVEELIGEGGKRQVPFLEDDNMTPYLIDDDVEMYESDAIVKYLEGKYGKDAKSDGDSNIKLHVDNDADVCESCE